MIGLEAGPVEVGGDYGLAPEGADYAAHAEEGAQGEFGCGPIGGVGFGFGDDEKDYADQGSEEYADEEGK